MLNAAGHPLQEQSVQMEQLRRQTGEECRAEQWRGDRQNRGEETDRKKERRQARCRSRAEQWRGDRREERRQEREEEKT